MILQERRPSRSPDNWREKDGPIRDPCSPGEYCPDVYYFDRPVGLVRYFRRQGINSSYWGALAIGELLILVQAGLGVSISG
jgi:hypothetical protein